MKWSLVPSKKRTFRSELSYSEVLLRMSERLDSEANKKALHQFEGRVGASGFEVWEHYRRGGNSFRPVVKGEVVPDGTGALIHIHLRMSGCVFAFVLLWCYVPMLVISLSIVTFFREGKFDATVLVMVGAVAFMTGLATLGFRSGVRTARLFIAEALGRVEEV